MKTGRFLSLLFVGLLNVMAADPPRPRMQLNSFSLKFQPSTQRIFGINYANQVSSQGEFNPPNGELRISPLETGAVPDVPPTHEGVFHYFDGQIFETFTLPFIVDVPADDTDGNHILDVYEFAPLVSARTQGLYLDPAGDIGTFIADWEKGADSAIGICRIRFDWGQTFPHFWENYQYEDELRPSVISSSGSGFGFVDFVRKGADGKIAGVLNFKLGAGEFTVARSSELTNELGGAFTIAKDSVSVLKDRKVYHLLEIADGTPGMEPVYEDFKEWSLLIIDPNDTDNDGVPNLLEGAPSEVPPPTLEIIKTPEGIRIVIRGVIGQTYVLEDANSMPAVQWLNPTMVTLTENSHLVDLPAPAGQTFWRARRHP